MKNTTTKVAILISAVAGVLIAVLFFIKTIVSPPAAVSMENLHIVSINDAIGLFKSDKVSSDSLYKAVSNKIILFHKEGYISDEQKDNATYTFVQAYLPIFRDQTYKKFNASVWKESDHKKIQSRINELRNLKIAYGNQPAVSGTYASDLKNIDGVIENYNKAKKVATKYKYTSVKQAKEDINEAYKYSIMPYVSNCKDLVNRLNKVKVNIGSSHYQYVLSAVYALAGYRQHSRNTYKTLIAEVNVKVKSYDDIRSIYGTSSRDATELRSMAATYVRDANKYYDSLEKPTISINTNAYSWLSFTSPSDRHYAYRSYSNQNKPSTDSYMSFTIKGFDSFTFYIRSNAESTCDYVMVGALNTKPSRSSNYVNTSGRQNAGTSLYSYTPVSYTNLDKSTSYTIYVTYTKDSSRNVGSDCGYVLIPKVQ